MSHNNIKSYQDTGSGLPIVLIHAFPTDQQLWEPQRQGLQRHFRIITLDLHGFGKSSPADGQAIPMSEYAFDVMHLLDQLQIEKAIIGGESMGGYIALAFLEKYPKRVSGLILSDTQSIPDTSEAKSKRETTAIDVLQNGTSTLIDGFIPKTLSAQAPDATRQSLKKILEAQSPLAITSALRGMALRTDTSHILAATQLPILIITGEQDIMVSPDQSEAMHTLAKNSKLVKIADAGHLPSFEKPEEWNAAVVDFFKH